jgi:hypothetical protein
LSAADGGPTGEGTGGPLSRWEDIVFFETSQIIVNGLGHFLPGHSLPCGLVNDDKKLIKVRAIHALQMLRRLSILKW